MRLQLPRGILAQQLSAHFLTLIVVGGMWAGCGAYFLQQMNLASDTRFNANRLRVRILEAERSAEAFLARDVQDPAFYLGMPIANMDAFERATDSAKRAIQSLERLRPSDGETIERMRSLLTKYEGAFLRVAAL